MKTAAVANPRSASGKTGRRWPQIAAALAARLGPVETQFTEQPGHAIALTRDLLEQGYERIIAVGGDGTINEVTNGFLRDDQPVRPGACLGILPLGTGGDFRRTLGVPSDFREALEMLAAGVPAPLDVGKAVFRGPDGASQARYFINLASFGMGGEVASRANNFLNPLGGRISFLYATAVSFLRYQRKEIQLRLDGADEPLRFSIYNVAVGNGRFHGAGMQACPTAVLNDGILEVTVIEYLRMLEAIIDFPVLYSDNVYRHPKVKHFRARSVVAQASDPVQIEIDGEPLGTLPLEITVLIRRIPVLVPPSSPLLS